MYFIFSRSNAKKESCFFPIPQAAECILRVVERSNAPAIYLSTDAAESETNLLQSLVVLNDKPVPLVKRPDHNIVEKWDALLYRNHIGGDSLVNYFLSYKLKIYSTFIFLLLGSLQYAHNPCRSIYVFIYSCEILLLICNP